MAKDNKLVLSAAELDRLIGIRVTQVDEQLIASLEFVLTAEANVLDPTMLRLDNTVPRLLPVEQPNALLQAPQPEPVEDASSDEPAEQDSPPVTLNISDQGAPHES